MIQKIRPFEGKMTVYSELSEAVAALKRVEGKGRIRYCVTQSPMERVWAQARAEAREALPRLIERYGRRCLVCETSKHLVVDHIVPLHRRGDSHIENLQVLCRRCNLAKGLAIIDYRPYPYDIRGIPCFWCETYTWNVQRIKFNPHKPEICVCTPCAEQVLEEQPDFAMATRAA